MSKNWSLILVVAFTLGFGVKAYLDSQHKLAAQVTTPLTLSGDNQQAVAIFDQADPRIRIVYFGFTRCPDVCPTSLAMLSAALNQVDDKTRRSYARCLSPLIRSEMMPNSPHNTPATFIQ